MNSAEILRRLGAEKKEWGRSGNSPEALWTIRGINIAIKHVRNILKEQAWNERIRKPRINRWFARELYRSAEVALGYLRRAEKKRAMAVLERVLEKTAIRPNAPARSVALAK